MANTFTAAIPKIFAQGVLALREFAIMPRLVNTDFDNEVRQKGDTIDVIVPSAVPVTDVTPGHQPTAGTDSGPTKVSIPLSNWKEAAIFLNDKEIAEIVNGVKNQQVSEAVKSLANNVDVAILALYKAIYGYAGTAGTTPFSTANDISDATNLRKVLNKQLAPLSPRRAVLDPDAEAMALGQRAFQDTSWRADAQGIIEGQIGRKMGFDWFMDQNVPRHVKGAAGTVLLDDTVARAVGLKTLHMDGFTTKASVGDVFTIAGDLQTYVVTAATDLATTDSDVSFEPGLKVAIPAADGNEAVTFKASHVVNLGFHRDAFALAVRPLGTPDGFTGGSEILSATDPISGLALRLEVSRQHKQNKYSFDILYGVKCVRPELAARLAGA